MIAGLCTFNGQNTLENYLKVRNALFLVLNTEDVQKNKSHLWMPLRVGWRFP